METHIPTTPFGQRQVSLGQISVQMKIKKAIENARKPGTNTPAAINKWQLFRTLTQIKDQLGVSDRTLSVLNALLSFQQETALSLPNPGSGAEREAIASLDSASEDNWPGSTDLVVFPSNKALCLRAHGMVEGTLRRHLSALVDAGLIIRRDSPNGKRYARKDISGQNRFSDAFGFDLIPLVVRATEFEAMAETVRLEQRASAILKERISLQRRDIAKLISMGLDEGLAGPWEDYRLTFLSLVTPLRRVREPGKLSQLSEALLNLLQKINNTLEGNAIEHNMSGNDDHNDRHQSNSNTEAPNEFEPSSKEVGASEGGYVGDDTAATTNTERDYPLGMVMEACPDVNDYKFSGGRVSSWTDFLETVATIRPMLGISPSAWQEAMTILGVAQAHIALATILQRSEHSSEARVTAGGEGGSPILTVNGSPAIKSAGGYLRALTEKARSGQFALGPVLMALIGQRMKVKRSGGSS